MLTGLNHITVAVKDLDLSLQFYSELLGFKPEVRWNTGADLTLKELWFCLILENPTPATDYSHIAFSVSDDHFGSVCVKLKSAGVDCWKENSSEGKSFYFLDPNGHKLEVHVGDLQTRLAAIEQIPYEGLQWL